MLDGARTPYPRCDGRSACDGAMKVYVMTTIPLRLRSLLRVTAVLALAAVASTSAAQVSASICGDLGNAYGPFDFRASHFRPAAGDNEPHAVKLRLVESAHFTPPVAAGIRGATTALPGGDLDYTLRVFPNHHKALATVIRIWERDRMPTPRGFSRPAECYFERAIRFQANDATARMLYASFLIKDGRTNDASRQLESAALEATDNPLTHHNIGLLYADAKLYEAALRHAHQALALGMQRDELRQRLQAAGFWREP
jgi:tetratricopeptide (TPR) repeat protein